MLTPHCFFPWNYKSKSCMLYVLKHEISHSFAKVCFILQTLLWGCLASKWLGAKCHMGCTRKGSYAGWLLQGNQWPLWATHKIEAPSTTVPQLPTLSHLQLPQLHCTILPPVLEEGGGGEPWGLATFAAEAMWGMAAGQELNPSQGISWTALPIS